MVSLDSHMHGLTFTSSCVVKHKIRWDCAAFRVSFLKGQLDFLLEAGAMVLHVVENVKQRNSVSM